MSNNAVLIRESKDVQASPTQMLQAIVQGGITPENMQAVEKAMELCYRMEARNAEKDFNAAFVALQSEIPVIVASSVIPNRGKYERFEDVMKVVKPLLYKHGFSVSFSQDIMENRIAETCHLSHVSGHSRSNTFAVRSGGKADSDTQADCKASTTAKRNALCNALNIVIRQDCLTEDNDAGILGDPNSKITAAQAEELERRVKETNSSVSAFLKFADAKTFSEISARKYDDLDAMLRKKEAQGK